MRRTPNAPRMVKQIRAGCVDAQGYRAPSVLPRQNEKARHPQVGASGPKRFEPAALVERVSRATEHVADLVPHQLFDAQAGWAHVFARVELFGALGEDLAEAGR